MLGSVLLVSSAALSLQHQNVATPVPPSTAKPAWRKQGFSGFLSKPQIGMDYSCDDATALGLQDSFYYTWTENTAQWNRCKSPAQQGAEFVPMINGVGQLKDGVTNHFQKEWAAANAHFLLGYNEPDPGNHPHQVEPAVAAEDWVHVQNAAEQLGLKLVSPAVSTTGLDDNGVSPWLDQFFSNCSKVPGCKNSSIDYIAFHDYQGNVSKIISRAEGLKKRYGKPVWITELAINKWARIVDGVCHNCNITREMEDAYMAEVLPALEKCDAVFRYMWYTARAKPSYPEYSGNLLVYNETTPTLTSTGKIYKDHAASMQPPVRPSSA